MRTWLKLLLLVALAGLGALWLAPDPGKPTALVGEPAPGVVLPDLTGRETSLSGWKGRAVAVNFWATWCAPCLEELPGFAAAWRESRGRCLEVVGIAEETGRDEAAAEAGRLGVGFPILLDEKGEAARAFGVTGYPHTVVIDADGRVREVFRGKISREKLEAALGPLVPPSCPERR